jgi:hypothetical protein
MFNMINILDNRMKINIHTNNRTEKIAEGFLFCKKNFNFKFHFWDINQSQHLFFD